jgi:hypothetical protein
MEIAVQCIQVLYPTIHIHTVRVMFHCIQHTGRGKNYAAGESHTEDDKSNHLTEKKEDSVITGGLLCNTLQITLLSIKDLITRMNEPRIGSSRELLDTAILVFLLIGTVVLKQLSLQFKSMKKKRRQWRE